MQFKTFYESQTSPENEDNFDMESYAKEYLRTDSFAQLTYRTFKELGFYEPSTLERDNYHDEVFDRMSYKPRYIYLYLPGWASFNKTSKTLYLVRNVAITTGVRSCTLYVNLPSGERYNLHTPDDLQFVKNKWIIVLRQQGVDKLLKSNLSPSDLQGINDI